MKRKFTGIVDSNKRKIYEGDKVKINNNIVGIVKKISGKCGPGEGLNIIKYILEKAYMWRYNFGSYKLEWCYCNNIHNLWHEVTLITEKEYKKISLIGKLDG